MGKELKKKETSGDSGSPYKVLYGLTYHLKCNLGE